MTATWREERINTLRELIVATHSGVVEETKWVKPSNPSGVPTFSCDGLICTLETYKDKVKVTFAKGASLPDPEGIFNASLDAGTRRAIDFFESDPVHAAAFTALILAAIAKNQSK